MRPAGPEHHRATDVEGPAIRADVIVVAAGRSTRMGGVDKLMADVGGRPLLARTLAALAAAIEVERIVVVTAAERVDSIRMASWLPDRVAEVVAGGDRRQVSVASGFSALDALDAAAQRADDPTRVVLVHDGARPLVTPELIGAVALATSTYGAAIPVLPVAETLKQVADGRVVATVDRETIGTAQTPQGVQRGLWRQATADHPPEGEASFTDEAALLEACRIPVHVVPGDPSNVKVTLPADLRQVASSLAVTGTTRVGIGHDSHGFGPGFPLALGGVLIDGAPRLHGHSDGDVALHAVCDALLGGAGLGDLGRLFPAGPSTPAGIESSTLLTEVVGRIAAAGWRVRNVDLTIIGARPRLAAHLDPIRDRMAGLLEVDPAAVNVKASSGNLAGDEGAGRSISTLAIATLEAVA